MHSQSFQNLEVRGAGLEIRVGAGCACIGSACFRCNGLIGLEIRVGVSYACIENACFRRNGLIGLEIRVGGC